MTREELKEHCKKQIDMCEICAIRKGEDPHGKIYEEHKLILELLEQETVSKESYDHEYFLRKELEMKIAKLEQDKNKVLDKIRAEINKPVIRDEYSQRQNDYCDGVEFVCNRIKEILDKYKAETEGNEDRNE